jgi:hypothetical protein
VGVPERGRLSVWPYGMEDSKGARGVSWRAPVRSAQARVGARGIPPPPPVARALPLGRALATGATRFDFLAGILIAMKTNISQFLCHEALPDFSGTKK